MKAAEIKPGDVIDGWTVTECWPSAWADAWYGDEEDGEFGEMAVILLELEAVYATYHGLDETKHTRRAWYRADEKVEVERE